jgi:molecular chaperone GrpE
MNENQIMSNKEETETKGEEALEELPFDEKGRLIAELQEINDKYLRLYAEFENYRKRVNKDKEELIRYGNESLLYELLPVIDNLEMALNHASNKVSEGLVQGVEITLKELQKTLEKFGLGVIDANGKPFNPLVHHAMTQVERDDVDENTVVEEFRKGYMFRDKVLRPSLVAVSKKPVGKDVEE